MRHVMLSVLLLVACGLAMPFESAAIPLSDLLVPGATLTQGDKLFSNFSADLTPDALPTVVEGNTIGGNHGFLISGTVTDSVGEVFTSVLDFKVTVTDPGFNIRTVSSTLSYTGTALGSVTLVGSFFADAAHTIALGSLGAAVPSSLTGSLTLSSDVHELFAHFSFVETGPLDGPFSVQTSFGQVAVTAPVPESSSLMLLFVGLVGLVWAVSLTRGVRQILD